MRVAMRPTLDQTHTEPSGVARVVQNYYRWLPEYGVEIVPEVEQADLLVSHASAVPAPDVLHCHGLYWTADAPMERWAWATNRDIIQSIRSALQITVPSSWVAETFRRDMHLSPAVIGHGLNLDEWQDCAPYAGRGAVLWNKNRISDVCSPAVVADLAALCPQQVFLSTCVPAAAPTNVRELGILAYSDMTQLLKSGKIAVYLATTKETFGIGTLEAMACGIPVLGYHWGGTADLVQHGVNGYLAQPHDLQDLVQGLDYCLRYRRTLGANGRALARGWTWQKAVEQVVAVYQQALRLKHQPAHVAVIIPCYNYASKVTEALDSLLAQTYPDWESVVVDDGSTDDTTVVVEHWIQAHPTASVRLLHQENQGVAHARNNGLTATSSKYCCCLDADDRVEPLFLQACVEALEADASLGIAYTGLRWFRSDGSSGESSFPPQFDYDHQLKRHNQIPTCCVFRRSLFERSGGYRQRYAPQGAGAEDAELWTRAGALGFDARKITDAPLFLYRMGEGATSQKEYQEVDWLAFHPWVRDGLHPFASVAHPQLYSHPVRQYDTPLVSVIIPVGTGHEQLVSQALDSLEAQTFRNWEAVVVDDTGGTDLDLTSFPFARLVQTIGKTGAGAARNAGVTQARAPFLLFLDADDMLLPDCLQLMLDAWTERSSIVYADYMATAQVDNLADLADDLQERVYSYDTRTSEALLGFRSADYDCERAQRQPEPPYYIWCNVTALIPKAWHNKVGGFDEKLASWEDWDYWIRLARAGYCFTHLPQELMLYRFNTGQRREIGLQTQQSLLQYLLEKRSSTTMTPCSGCGGRATIHPAPPASVVGVPTRSGVDPDDAHYILCEYVSGNAGQSLIYGGVTRINYGYHTTSERFLVHIEDVRGQPNRFIPIAEVAAPPTESPMVVVEPPVRLAEAAPTTKKRSRRS